MKYLVVDSGPLIKGARIEIAQARTYITVPEVLREIRDRQARSGMQLLPFELATKEPSDEAIARVSAFARKTGDYAALSGVDMKVLALTWMLEKECNGAAHLRDTPAPIQPSKPRRAAPPPPPSAPQPPEPPGVQPPASGSANGRRALDAPGGQSAEEAALEVAAILEQALADVPDAEGDDDEEDDEAGGADAAAPPAAPDAAAPDASAPRGVSVRLEACGAAAVRVVLVRDGRPLAAARAASGWVRLPGWARAAAVADAAAGAADGAPHAAARTRTTGHRAHGAQPVPPASSAGGEDGDELAWITPDTLKRAQRRDGRYGQPPDASVDVCCMSTDFAMQNVLMRMGMKLLSTDGLVMRSVKQWGVQCSGCFRTARDVSRQFCSHCGNATLVRVALVVDRHGRQRVLRIPEHVRARIMSTRGTRYTMAAPKQGRNAGNEITAEDALAEARWKHIRNGGARKSTDVFDPNYDFDAHFGRSGKQAKGRAGKEPTVGHGRKNPNDVRSRPKKR